MLLTVESIWVQPNTDGAVHSCPIRNDTAVDSLLSTGQARATERQCHVTRIVLASNCNSEKATASLCQVLPIRSKPSPDVWHCCFRDALQQANITITGSDEYAVVGDSTIS